MKFLKWLLIFFVVMGFWGWLMSDDEAPAASDPAPTSTSAPAPKPVTKRPNVEFSYGYTYVKLRAYSCKPCSESQANSAADLLGTSGINTAHAFFDMDAGGFQQLEGKISRAKSWVEAEQIIKEANPKQFRRVMANGTMLDY